MYKRASRFLQHIAEKSKPRKGVKDQKPEISRKLIKAFDSQELIKGRFEKRVKGGYIFLIDGFPAFCPNSEMYPIGIAESELTNPYPRLLEFEVIKMEIGRDSVVISRKRAVQRTLGTGEKLFSL